MGNQEYMQQLSNTLNTAYINVRNQTLLPNKTVMHMSRINNRITGLEVIFCYILPYNLIETSGGN